jgi:plastocyanin
VLDAVSEEVGMQDGQRRMSARRGGRCATAVTAAAMAFLGGVAWAQLASPARTVSQKDQAFNPSEITIKRGETVRIVNDDGELLHHAYVDSPQFSFDSGDQEPGAKVDITFPVTGTFTVLCGIHPKMKLRVHVD